MTVEDPRETGRRGGLAAAETKRRDREEPLNRVRRELPGLMRELLNASKGEGKWKDLPVNLRLQALLKCIEYGVGRPVSLDRTASALSSNGDGGAKEEVAGLTFE